MGIFDDIDFSAGEESPSLKHVEQSEPLAPDTSPLSFLGRVSAKSTAANGTSAAEDAYGSGIGALVNALPFFGSAISSMAASQNRAFADAAKTGRPEDASFNLLSAGSANGALEREAADWDAREGAKYDAYAAATKGRGGASAPYVMQMGEDGRYHYVTDDEGNKILDESYAGGDAAKQAARAEHMKAFSREILRQRAQDVSMAQGQIEADDEQTPWYSPSRIGASVATDIIPLGLEFMVGGSGVKALAKAGRIKGLLQAAGEGSKAAKLAATQLSLIAPIASSAMRRYNQLRTDDFGLDEDGNLVIDENALGTGAALRRGIAGAVIESELETYTGDLAGKFAKATVGRALKGIANASPAITKLFQTGKDKAVGAVPQGVKDAVLRFADGYGKIQRMVGNEVKFSDFITEDLEEWTQGVADDVFGFGNKDQADNKSLAEFTRDFLSWDKTQKDLLPGLVLGMVGMGAAGAGIRNAQVRMASAGDSVRSTLKANGATDSDIARMSYKERVAVASKFDPRVAQEIDASLDDLLRYSGMKESVLRGMSEEQKKQVAFSAWIALNGYGQKFGYKDAVPTEEDARKALDGMSDTMQEVVQSMMERNLIGDYRELRNNGLANTVGGRVKFEDVDEDGRPRAVQDGNGDMVYTGVVRGADGSVSATVQVRDVNGEGKKFTVSHTGIGNDGMGAGLNEATFSGDNALENAFNSIDRLDRHAQMIENNRAFKMKALQNLQSRIKLPGEGDAQGPLFRYYNTMDDILEDGTITDRAKSQVAEQVARGKATPGFRLPDGTFAFVLDEIKDYDDLVVTFVHEVLGHGTINEFFDNDQGKVGDVSRSARKTGEGAKEGESDKDAEERVVVARSDARQKGKTALLKGFDPKKPGALRELKTKFKLWLNEKTDGAVTLGDEDLDAIAAWGLKRLRQREFTNAVSERNALSSARARKANAISEENIARMERAEERLRNGQDVEPETGMTETLEDTEGEGRDYRQEGIDRARADIRRERLAAPAPESGAGPRISAMADRMRDNPLRQANIEAANAARGQGEDAETGGDGLLEDTAGQPSSKTQAEKDWDKANREHRKAMKKQLDEVRKYNEAKAKEFERLSKADAASPSERGENYGELREMQRADRIKSKYPNLWKKVESMLKEDDAEATDEDVSHVVGRIVRDETDNGTAGTAEGMAAIENNYERLANGDDVADADVRAMSAVGLTEQRMARDFGYRRKGSKWVWTGEYAGKGGAKAEASVEYDQAHEDARDEADRASLLPAPVYDFMRAWMPKEEIAQVLPSVLRIPPTSTRGYGTTVQMQFREGQEALARFVGDAMRKVDGARARERAAEERAKLLSTPHGALMAVGNAIRENRVSGDTVGDAKAEVDEAVASLREHVANGAEVSEAEVDAALSGAGRVGDEMARRIKKMIGDESAKRNAEAPANVPTEAGFRAWLGDVDPATVNMEGSREVFESLVRRGRVNGETGENIRQARTVQSVQSVQNAQTPRAERTAQIQTAPQNTPKTPSDASAKSEGKTAQGSAPARQDAPSAAIRAFGNVKSLKDSQKVLGVDIGLSTEELKKRLSQMRQTTGRFADRADALRFVIADREANAEADRTRLEEAKRSQGGRVDAGEESGYGDERELRFREATGNVLGDLGFHYGDLGVGRDTTRGNMTRGRGTGHFGTGVYFFGERQTKGIAEGRPEHAVDFSQYNLAKVGSTDDAEKLHNFLRRLNNYYGFGRTASQEDIRSVAERVDDALNYEDRGVAHEAAVAMLEDAKSVGGQAVYEEISRIASRNGWDKDFGLAGRLRGMTSEEAVSEIERIAGPMDFDDGSLDDFGLRIRAGLEDYRTANAHAEASEPFGERMAGEVARILGVDAAEVADAARDIVENGVDTPEDGDSASTVFMKRLGFEGVDVRGTGADNASVGSVVYNLKPESVRFRERPTAADAPRDMTGFEYRGFAPSTDVEKAIDAFNATGAKTGLYDSEGMVRFRLGSVEDALANLMSDPFQDGDRDRHGQETSHVVRRGDKVYKFRLPDNSGDHELEKVALHNAMFPDTAYTVVGIAKDADGRDVTVLEQPYVEFEKDSGQRARQILLEEMRERFGDAEMRGNEIHAGGWMLDDLKDLNVGIDARTGRPAVIDAIVHPIAEMPEKFWWDVDRRAKDAEGDGGDARFRSVTPQEDADYMAAVESGDLYAAGEMVRKAASANYDTSKTVFHAGSLGTNTVVGEPTYVFWDNPEGFHVGTLKAATERFSDVISGQGEFDFKARKTEDGKYVGQWGVCDDVCEETNESYETADDAEWAANQLLHELLQSPDTAKEAIGVGGLLKLHELYLRKGLRLKEMSDIIGRGEYSWEDSVKQAKEEGYDGIVYKNEGEDVGSTSYLVWNNPDVKSAEPVTYDDDGNVIPLSQRFDTKNNDIRFRSVPRGAASSYADAAGLSADELGERMGIPISREDDARSRNGKSSVAVERALAESHSLSDVIDATRQYGLGAVFGQVREVAVRKLVDSLRDMGLLEKRLGIGTKGSVVHAMDTANGKAEDARMKLGFKAGEIKRLIAENDLNEKWTDPSGRETGMDKFSVFLQAMHGAERNRLGAERSRIVKRIHDAVAANNRAEGRKYMADKSYSPKFMKTLNAVLRDAGDIPSAAQELERLGLMEAKELGELEAALSYSGRTTQEWNDILDQFDREGYTAKAMPAAQMVWDMNRETLDRLVASGRISARQAGTWKRLSPHYVPMRTDAEGSEDGILGELMGGSSESEGFGKAYSGREFRRATGRTTLADSPLVFSIMQAEQAINRALDNESRAKLAKIVRDNSKIGEVVDFSDSSNWDKVPRRKVVQNGLTTWVPDMSDYEAANDNVVAFKENGDTKYIVLGRETATDENGELDMRTASRIAKSVRRENLAQLGGAMRAVRALSRGFGALRTSLSPTFMISNVLADQGQAKRNLVATFGQGAWTQFTKLAVPFAKDGAYESVKRYLNGSLGSSQMDRWTKEWAENGGRIGGFATESFRDMERELAKDVKDLQDFIDGTRRGKVSEFLKRNKDRFDKLAQSFEMGTRVAAYAVCRQNNMSIEDSVRYARDVTVNFNRKGEWSPVTNALWVFSNAGVQDMVRTKDAFLASPHGFSVMGQLFVLGIVSAMLGFGQDDPEDEINGVEQWKDQGEWRKQNGIVARIGGKVLSVPLRGLARIPYYFGHKAFEFMSGNGNGSELRDMAVFAASNLTDPIGNAPTVLQNALPSVLRPLAEIGENTTFTGAKLHRDAYSDRDVASENGRRTTSPVAAWVAKALNRATGGSRTEKGLVDVYPETVAHMAEWLTGTLGRDAAQLAGVAWDLATFTSPESVRKVPGLNRFASDLANNSARYRDALGRYETDAKTAEVYGDDRAEMDALESRAPYFKASNKAWKSELDGIAKSVRKLVKESASAEGEEKERLDGMRHALQGAFLYRLENRPDFGSAGRRAEVDGLRKAISRELEAKARERRRAEIAAKAKRKSE